MNILFLTVSNTHDISEMGIYTDLMRAFVRNGHNVYIVCPFERRIGRKTELYTSSGANILGVRTLNIKKTNAIEKGIGTLLLERQYMRAINEYLSDIKFDLVLYTTPPITLNRVIDRIKKKYKAQSYLLLKDIFPQNAVDLGMISKFNPLYWIFRYKERRLYELSDYIGCMSPANVEYVLRHNPEVSPHKVHINPNSIELQEQPVTDKQSVRLKYGLPTDKIVFIYGGNLGRPQDIDFLLQILDHYRANERVFFMIAGSGTEYNKVSNWFVRNNPTNAKLLPYIPKQDYDLLVYSCDVGMIFLDRRFTIPNYPSRLLAYLKNRVPVIIATDKNCDMGRIAEQNNFGLWSESGDLDAFDRNLQQLLDRQTIAEKGEHGYRFLLDNYTVDKTYSIIINSISK